jgi:hypothetical protein
VEGDLVNSFFDSVDQMKDSTLYQFIEGLKRDIEQLVLIMYSSPNEVICFFTHMVIMLRCLNPIDHSYVNVVHMCKNLAREINEPVVGENEIASISQQTHMQLQRDFNKFFMGFLLRSYCQIFSECPQKRQSISEVIYAHC